MEKRSMFLRRLPKRSALLLYLLLAMVGACAVVTLYLQQEEALPSNVPTTDNFKLGTTNDDLKSTTAKFVPPGWSWTQDRYIDNSSTANRQASDDINTIISNLSSSQSQANKISRRRPQRRKTFHDNTKYIYLTTAPNASSTTSATIVKNVTTTPPTSRNTCDSSDEKDTKLILLWTSFFGYWEYMPKDRFKKCARCRNCRVTKDRRRLAESDAVVFHARDLSLFDLPPFRLPHQRWVFYCLESPPYSDFAGLQHMKHMFNWTMTYRSDSDVVSQYGSVKRIRPSQPIDLQNLKSAFTNKSRSVVWMSSHCPTHGGRDAYVKELRKYIDVDTYGTCGTSVCPPGATDKCLEDFSDKYKFFLAFENTICKDYITEKFFRTLRFDIVPVVFGGATYDRFAPPGSFIDALSFKSPKHLAFFLAGVGRDFKMYSSYFRWRKDYTVRLMNEKECGMCSLLHRTDLKPSSYADLNKWWVKESRCRSWTPKS